MKIKQLLKGDKKRSIGIYILLLLGVLFLAFGSFPKSGEVSSEEQPAVQSSAADYAAGLEARLEDILSSIEGAGKVRVMLVAENSGSISVEKDGSGENSKTVILTKQGGSEALVLEENEPGIRGALIVAEGGGSDKVKAELAEAAATALGLGLHRVKVYKMISD